VFDGANIFTVLKRMDYAISQLRPKKEQTTAPLKQCLTTDQLTNSQKTMNTVN
jgi:hypothetical protein